jgi:hypothetical protein
VVGRRAAGVLFGAIVALAILEFGVRLLPAPVLGFSYEGGHFLPPREYERQTLRNGLGVHDVEPTPIRERGRRRRVLLLGDSYVAAISVPVEQGVASGSTPEGVLAPEDGAARLRGAHPALAGLDFDVDLVDRELERRCRALGIPFRALQPALRALEATDGPLHWRHDGHWNEAGNDAAARLLADFVTSGVGLGP